MTGSYRSTFLIFMLIMAGEGIFLLPFVLVRVFKPTYLAVFQVSNLELGMYFSIYGAVAMASYFFGGPLADKYPARKLIAIALFATGTGGLILNLFPSKLLLPYLYGYWGFTTIFLFWAAMIRAVREWGGDDIQGKAFGFFEAGRGAIAALIATFSILIFSLLIPDTSKILSEERNSAFQTVLLSSSLLIIFIGAVIWYMGNFINSYGSDETTSINFKILGRILRMPAIWLQAGIVVSGYVGYKVTDNIPLYAHEVLNLDEVFAAQISTASLWFRPFCAIAAGYMADKIKGSRVIALFFIINIIFSGVLISGIANVTMVALFSISFLVIGIYGVRGIYFALMNEVQIPIQFTGTSVGVISVIGFTPDVFMTPLMGFFLDTYPGMVGHQLVFGVLGSVSVFGLLAAILLSRLASREI